MVDLLENRILELAAEHSDKEAVIFKQQKLTYRRLALEMILLTEYLKENGAVHGDRICFNAASRPETVVLYLAVHLLGGICVPLDKNGAEQAVFEICRRVDSRFLLTDRKYQNQDVPWRILPLREVYRVVTDRADRLECQEGAGSDASLFWKQFFRNYRIDRDEEDAADILFTSGTTGIPKGVVLSSRAVTAILKNTISGVGITGEDILLLPLPLHHSLALRELRANLYTGAAIVLQNGFLFAKETENNIRQHRCNAMVCVPTSFEILKEQMGERIIEILGLLNHMEFGAGALTVRQRKEITEMLPSTRIINTWGSTETGGAIFCDVTSLMRGKSPHESLGIPLEGSLSIRIQDENGNEIQADSDHPGILALSGDMLMTGYWGDEENTREALHGGWLVTKDLVYPAGDQIIMLGRADDMINMGGEKISPIEIENLIGLCPCVKECACIGIEDPENVYGQIPILFLSVCHDYTEEKLYHFLAGKLERVKYPRRIIILDTLPRNRMQKLDRKKLREMQSISLYLNQDQHIW